MRDLLTPALPALAFVALLGCGSSDQPAAPGQPAPTPPAPMAANPNSPSNLKLSGNIETGRSVTPEQRMADATSIFIPSDDVWASVIVEGAAPQATLVARFVRTDGGLVNQATQQVTPGGMTPVAFRAPKPDGGWPLGGYRVEILLNGVAVGTRGFEVREPPL